MSFTALTWVAFTAALFILSFRRPAYAVGLYMLSFFAAPQLWWWGDEIPYARYSLVSGIVLLGAVLWRNMTAAEDAGHRLSVVHKLAVAMAVNATLVHVVLAVNRSVSIDTYTELLKFSLLTFLIWSAIRDRQDLRIVLCSIALGAAYMGYEITINERGDLTGSRLEGVGAPGATTSNGLACVMLTVLPLVGGLLVDSSKRMKAVVLVAAPLTLNVLLLCNSRGAFLGLIGAGLTFLLVARGPTRKKAIRALALGSVLLYMLLGDPEILERFSTTFVGSEQRDNAAAGRLEYWQAGLAMLADYPLGAGGGAFKYDLGVRYHSELTGREDDRSLHNGYLTEATDWGIQGLILKLLFIGAAFLAAYRTSRQCQMEGRAEDSIVGMCLMAAMTGFLLAAVFGAYLNNEWGYWTVALLLRYSELYRVAEAPAAVAAPVPTHGATVLDPVLPLAPASPHTARRAPEAS